MAIDWYYTHDGARRGPVTGRELADLARTGRLRPDDQVWKDGMAGWRPAAKLTGLFPADGPGPASPDTDMAELLKLDVAGVVNRIWDTAAAAARRVEAKLAGPPGGLDAESPRPVAVAKRPAVRPPTGPGGGRDQANGSPEDGGGIEPAAAILGRVERLLKKVYDKAVPTAGLEAELAELRRAVEGRQAHLRRLLEQAERDRREGRRRRDALREAVRLATAARDARRAGRPDEAARLDAQADRARAGVPRLSEEDQRAAVARLRERLETLQGEEEVMTKALKLLRDAAEGVANRRRIEELSRNRSAATPPTAAAPGPHPASGFGTWYARSFGPLASGPPAVAWPLQAAVWSLGLGFMWIPMLYLAGKYLACPACGLLWVRTTEGEKLLDRRRGFGQVAREDSHYDREGRYVGGTRRTEQVVMNNDVVRVDYACKSCGHSWAEVEGRSSEA